MSGITLFHAGRSNCSARVRLLLAEKRISWHSRLISLRDKENRTPEYFAINPKGLVPALLHNGWVITESNDILDYLEDTFPAPAFRPFSASERAAMLRWMELSADLHLPGIKTLNYSRNRSGVVTEAADEMNRYRKLQSDPALLRFHEKAATDGFTADERTCAEQLVGTALRTMDEVLAQQPWLAGESYSLADICWAPTLPTLVRAGLNIDPFPQVRAWHRRIIARRAYGESVTHWEEGP